MNANRTSPMPVPIRPAGPETRRRIGVRNHPLTGVDDEVVAFQAPDDGARG
jgi:hypothetical protein